MKFWVDIRKPTGFEFSQYVYAENIAEAKRTAKQKNPGCRVVFAMQLPETQEDLIAQLQEYQR